MKVRRITIAIAFAALCSLVAVPVAGAAAWQPGVPISAAGVNSGDFPKIAMGPSGDAAAIWWDDGVGGRLVVARRLPGGAWTAPVPVASSATPVLGQIAVDAAGTITAFWTLAGPATQMLTWARAAGGPTVQTVPVGTPDVDDNVPPGQLPGEAMSVYSLAVNANGDAVVAGTGITNVPTRVILGYRNGATGTFVFSFKAGLTFSTPVVAINDAGAAAVVYRSSNAALWGARRAPGGAFGPTDVILTAPASSGSGISVAVDGAGTAFAAYLTGTSPNFVVGTALSPPGGGWQPSPDLSPAGVAQDSVGVDVAPSGAALLTWQQGTGLGATIEARAGSTLTGSWAPAQTVNDAGSLSPVAAIGNDGMAVVAWQRITGVSASGQARVRGTDGVWGTTTTILPAHSGTTTPSIATDGVGDFATVATGNGNSDRSVMLAVYDAAPPVVSEIGLAGSPLAGDPLALSVTATDAWSGVAAPGWAFGDGSAGSGLSVAHAFAAAGTYTSTVVVTDASGNAVSRTITSTIGAHQATLTSAAFAAKWKQSRVKGTLTVKGTAPRGGAYAVEVFRGKTRTMRASYTLTAGAFSRAIKLPAKLIPGTYRVALVPSFPATVVQGAGREVKLAAPIEGVVDKVVLSGKNNGPSARTLRNATTIWVSFRFVAKPKGKLTLTWYRTPKKGKKVKLGTTSKSPAAKVGSYLALGGVLRGTFTAVLARNGKIIAQGSVKAT